jgi:hypothetical protein
MHVDGVSLEICKIVSEVFLAYCSIQILLAKIFVAGIANHVFV